MDLLVPLPLSMGLSTDQCRLPTQGSIAKQGGEEAIARRGEEEEEGEEEVTTRRISMQRPSTLPLCLQHSTCTTKDFLPNIIDPTISRDCISMSPMSSLAQYMYTTKNAYLLAISWELKELCWCQNNQIFNAVIDCQKNTEKNCAQIWEKR